MKRARILIAILSICGAAGGLFVLARSLAQVATVAPLGAAVSIASAVILILLLGSLYEWIVHRFVYHGPSRLRILENIHQIHTTGHHWHRFPPTRYVEALPVKRIPVYPAAPLERCTDAASRNLAWLGQYALYMSVAVPFAFLPAWLVTRNVPFTLGAVGSGLVVCYLFIRVHDVMHYPGLSPWMERQSWFQFLDRHHYIHHVDNMANLNFLLPLCDWMFGTLRRRLSQPEAGLWPTFEAAKAGLSGDSAAIAEGANPTDRSPAQV
ncbi:MAG: hypothetical protein IT449_01990 [Phycisphaerales bacterium]|nr:hypothetical protein [Phycisphaerales bacterium]